MNKKYVGVGMLLLLLAGIVVFGSVSANRHKGKEKEESERVHLEDAQVKPFDEVKETYQDEIKEAVNGKYPNLKLEEDMKCEIQSIEKISCIRMEQNMDYCKNTHQENLNRMKETVENFFGESFDIHSMVATVLYGEKEQGFNAEELSYEQLQTLISQEQFQGDKYFILFGDAREKGKGFAQIDTNLFNVWFSRGEMEATMPMMSYNTKKVYNLTTGKGNLNDQVELLDGNITIRSAIEYVEDFLNRDLPYEKNEDYIYKVAEVRVLDVDGQDALGFCVRRTYHGIAFDYVDGITCDEFNSDYMDDRGEICMIKTNEIDNMCGLTGSVNEIQEDGKEITEILSLDSALGILSESIGENSIYDVYGMEIVYQVVEQDGNEDDGEIGYIQYGRPKWKIMAKNQNDDKYTWFYVDLENGEMNYRFQDIFEE